MAEYVAVAALVIGKDEESRDVYFYQGSPAPANLTEESLARLAKEGFIKEIETAEDAVTIPEGDPDDSWKVAQLKAYAETLSIDLEGATKKDDILAVIVASSNK